MTGLFVLVGRLPPLERVAGQDRLLRLHTAVAVALPCAVVVHATLVLLGGSALGAQPALAYTQALVRSGLTVLVAMVAATLLVVVAVTSTRWLRGRLRYEWWHALHVTVYVALAGALLHQVVLGTDLLRHPGLRTMWVAAVAAVLASALAFRLV